MKDDGKAKERRGGGSTAAKAETFDVHVRNVKLSAECRKRLRKVKEVMWGNVANAIECPEWFIPVTSHKFTHMKRRLESGMKKFFGLKEKVEVEDFDTNIIEYDNHRPSRRRKPR